MRRVLATIGIVLASVAMSGTAALAGPTTAGASTTFTVACGNIKLLEKAVGTPGATVNLAGGCTYHLTTTFVGSDGCGSFCDLDELPPASGSVTVNGHGATLLGVPACCPLVLTGRILEIAPQGHLTLNSVTLTGGNVQGQGNLGGGLLVNSGATAILNGSVVKNNSAACNCGSTGSGAGGGIENLGTITLNASRVIGNLVPDGGTGAGIFSSGTLRLQNSQVNGNLGESGANSGGIWASGTATLIDSSVSGNRVSGADGGKGNFASVGGIGFGGGTLTLLHSTVARNSVVVPCCGSGATLAQAGGLSIFGAPSGPSVVVINQSQIHNNSVSSTDPAVPTLGGGLYNSGGTVSFTGGAVEFNDAFNTGGGAADGGGIFNDSSSGGTITFSGTTVTSNQPDNFS